MSEEHEPPFEGRKLHRVQVEFTTVVLARDCRDAEKAARDTISEIVQDIENNGDAFYSAYEVHDVPREWRMAIPYGDYDGDATCQQILDMIKEYEDRPRPPTRAEIEAAGQQRLIEDVA